MPWLDWIWVAWNRLRDEVPPETVGMSSPLGGTVITSKPRRIPWSAIRTWSEDHSHDDEDRDMLDRCLMAMDLEYLAWWDERERLRMKS